MKNILSISGVMLLIVSIFLYHSCKEKPTLPIVATIPVSAISYTTAASGGAVTNEGGAPVTGRGVCWSTSVDPNIINSKTTESGGFGAFTSKITQLTANTLYYVRAWATNVAGTGYGNQFTFTTSPSVPPTLTTTAITSITQVSAVSGGNITNDNGASVTARGVCWSTTTGPTTALSTKTTDGAGTGAFESSITGLIEGTSYFVRAYATNSVGTAYGNQVSFTTNSVPTLTTTTVSSITQSGAISGGKVISDGGSFVTARGICWSTTTEPTIALNTKTTDGNGTGAFASNIIGLTGGTLYHVRAYATNSVGTAYGNQVSFFRSSGGQTGTVYKGHFYYTSSKNLSWSDANTYCKSFDGHLVIINDAEENNFVWNLCNRESFNIGLSDIEEEQVWRWVDGTLCRKVVWNFSNPICAAKPIQWNDGACTITTDFGFNNWKSGEPNSCGGLDLYGFCTDETYAEFNNDGTWNDVTGFGRFIIEWEYVPDVEIMYRLLVE